LRVIISFYDNGYLEGAYQLLLRFLSYFSDEKPENTEAYAFMALCCHDLKRYDEFLKYLKKSCEVNPNECRLALSHLFPDELQPQDYYEYIKEKIMQ
jgi:tetratricopeptide (TPR) repeat protein